MKFARFVFIGADAAAAIPDTLGLLFVAAFAATSSEGRPSLQTSDMNVPQPRLRG
jgi:hypothetical protein